MRIAGIIPHLHRIGIAEEAGTAEHASLVHADAGHTLLDERFGPIETLFPVFKERLRQYAGSLSGGEQKMLLVARTLMARPSVILLDEITEGLQPTVVQRIAAALRWEREQRGTAMLVVEQHVGFALDVCDRYLVLKQGEIVDDGRTGMPGAAERPREYGFGYRPGPFWSA